jgi:SSS family transporter
VKILIAIFILPVYFRRNITTPYEYLGEHLGRGGQICGSSLFACALYIGAAFRIYVGAIPLKVATGLDLTSCLLIISVLAMAYTLMGGLRAVIWTDVFQMLLFFLGGAIALTFALDHLSQGWTSLFQSMRESGRISPLDQPYLVETGIGPLPGGEWGYDWTQPHTFFAGFFGAAVLTLATHGTDHSNLQRLLACVSLAKARLAIVVSAVIVFLQFVLFLLVGAAVGAFYEQRGSHPDLETGNSILPYFITHELPAGLSGLLIAGIFAAAMSTVDSALSALSATTVTDLVRDRDTTGNPLKKARFWVIAWGILLWFGSQGAAWVGESDLIGSIFSASTTIYGPLLGLFLMALVLYRDPGPLRNPFPIWISLAIGLLVQAGFFLWSQKGFMGEDAFSIAWPWVTPIGALATFLPALLMTRLFGKPSDIGSD